MTEEKTIHTRAPDPWNIGFGLVLMTFAAVALFVWFPADITGSFIETNQVGKRAPGDAFFPILLASGILLLSGIHVLSVYFSGKKTENSPDESELAGRISAGNLKFLIKFHLVTFSSLLIMYFLGPLVVSALNGLQGSDLTYRQLTDTAPYKYIGFAVGAFVLTLPIIAWSEGKWSWRAVIVVLAVVIATIVIYDLLLRNVQIPPNANY